MDGTRMWVKSLPVDSMEDSGVSCMMLEPVNGLSPVHFLRLTLTQDGNAVSTNFYLRGLEEGNYRAIRELPQVKLTAATNVVQKGDKWILTTELSNQSATPALMTRLKVVREQSGDRILPAIYSDNYIYLMPGERRTITTDVNHADTRGEKPRMVVSGFNVVAI
jgi:Exo-beta-D-glucosaminidase Ig-fold domain